MNAERLTESALQMVASAQQIAQTRQHQTITPVHLVTALLSDGASPAARVVERAGGNLAQIRASLDTNLSRLPKVSGGDGQYMSNDMTQVFDEAERLAKGWGDSFVAADTLLVAARFRAAKDLGFLPDAGALESTVKEIRGGRTVDSKSAENTFEALERYGIDLTKQARDGKLDPVIGRD
ncbi:MAG: Clp protease N-terminal domain-containing protein, partial [Trueperaceae bacterium]